MRGSAPAIATLLLAAALAAPGEEPVRLGGGFSRPVPTRTPTPRPTPSPAAVRRSRRPSGSRLRVGHACAPRRGGPAARAARPARPRPPAARPPGSRAASAPPRAAADVSVGYVLVPFVVTDRKGRPVGDLREKDVTLLADGVPVAYDLFQGSADAPVSYAVLLDGSGSMGLAGKMEGARAALETLAATRVPGDDFALFVFAEGEVKEVVGFTEDAGRIVAAARQVKPWGKTAFRDALARMPEKSLQGKNGSKAIILLSDGIDNDSADHRDRAREADGGGRDPGLSPRPPLPGALMQPLPGHDRRVDAQCRRPRPHRPDHGRADGRSSTTRPSSRLVSSTSRRTCGLNT